MPSFATTPRINLESPGVSPAPLAEVSTAPSEGRNLRAEALNGLKQRMNQGTARFTSAIPEAPSLETSPVKKRENTPGQSDEITPNKPDIKLPSISTNLREQLDNLRWPEPEELRNSPIETLRAVYQENRKVLESVVESIKETIPQLALSGRGKLDLEKIFQERAGTYPSFGGGSDGSLMVWGIRGALTMDPATLVNHLEQACFRAIGYAAPAWQSRKQFDPDPGGIMVIIPDSPLRPRDKGHDPLRPGEWDEKNPVGEDTISLNPENFAKVVVGAISADRFAAASPIVIDLTKKMVAIREQRGSPVEHDDAYFRCEIVKFLQASGVLSDTLKLLTPHTPTAE